MNKKGIIISGFAGVGKTELAKRYNNIIDIESSNYKWVYNTEKLEKMNSENRKGIDEKDLNIEWPYNYIQIILENRNKYDIVLIAFDSFIRSFLEGEGIDYMICIPDSSCKKEYVERYKKRGNGYKFINLMKKIFENGIYCTEKENKNSMVLFQNETLESKLKEMKII